MPRRSTIVASPSRFLDTALKKAGPFSLCYVQADLKWVIRKHICNLLADHKALMSRAEFFTYDDGSTAYLLNVYGVLPLKQMARSPPFPAEIYVSIWLHPRYPIDPPSCSISLTPAGEAFAAAHIPLAFTLAHPFVDSTTGSVTTPYLLKWGDPSSSSSTPNLSQFVSNLIKIFTYWPPFPFVIPPPPAGPTATAVPLGQQSPLVPIAGSHSQDIDAVSGTATAAAPGAQQVNSTLKAISKSRTSSLASPREAADRLAMALLHKLRLLIAEVHEYTRGHFAAQARLKDRSAAYDLITSISNKELDQLRQDVQRVNASVNDHEEWLERMDKSRFPEHAPEEVFLSDDDESRRKLEERSGFEAIDDVIHWLDKAAEKKVVPVMTYLQQVRELAREQASFVRREAVSTLLSDADAD